jgi:HK97 gp10 family phage protein
MGSLEKIKLDLIGLPEIKALCRELPGRTAVRALRRACNLAATPILKTMRKNSPDRTGTFRKSLVKKVRIWRRGVVAAVVIGPDRHVMKVLGMRSRGKSKGDPIRHVPAKIAHLVNRGHGGPHPAQAHPFINPAYEQNKERSSQMVFDVVLKVLRQEAAKLGRK